MPVSKPPALADRVATRAIMAKLPELMEQHGWDVADVVAATGINQATVYALKRGDYGSELGGDKMVAIAIAFDLTISELTGF